MRDLYCPICKEHKADERPKNAVLVNAWRYDITFSRNRSARQIKKLRKKYGVLSVPVTLKLSGDFTDRLTAKLIEIAKRKPE